LAQTRKRAREGENNGQAYLYGYPPDLSDEAVKLVLEQAETLLREEAIVRP